MRDEIREEEKGKRKEGKRRETRRREKREIEERVKARREKGRKRGGPILGRLSQGICTRTFPWGILRSQKGAREWRRN